MKIRAPFLLNKLKVLNFTKKHANFVYKNGRFVFSHRGFLPRRLKALLPISRVVRSGSHSHWSLFPPSLNADFFARIVDTPSRKRDYTQLPKRL